MNESKHSSHVKESKNIEEGKEYRHSDVAPQSKNIVEGKESKHSNDVQEFWIVKVETEC